MNPKLRIILLLIGLITLLGVIVLFLPRSLSLYHQIKGGQIMNAVYRSLENQPDFGLTCDALPSDEESARLKVDQAIVKLQKALAYNNENAQASLLLGQAYCLLGQPETARQYFISYIQLRPKNPLGHMGYAFASEVLGDQDSALEGWEKAGLISRDFYEAGQAASKTKLYPNALRWFQRATIIGPNDAEAWLALGDTYDQLNMPDEALESYQIAWVIDPEISTSALAISLKKKGDYQGMEAVLRDSLHNLMDSDQRLQWWETLGDSLRFQKKWNDLIKTYQSAIQEYPHEEELYIELGWGYYDSRDSVELAEKYFNQAIKIDESTGEGYFALARFFAEEKRHDEADFYFLQALERSPSNRSYLLARADNILISGKLDQAIQIYIETTDRFPDFAQAYYQLALAYKLMGSSQEAVQAIEKAIELMKSPVDTYYTRAGEIYRWAGIKDKAIKAYHQALILNPANSVAQRGLKILGEK